MVPPAQLLATAHEVIRGYLIPEGSEIYAGEPVTHAWLVACLQLFVAVEQVEIPSDDDVAPDASRFHGRPALPPGLAWPDGYYFEAQLNLAEVARHDPHGVVPDHGMLYLFFDPTRKDFTPASPTACCALFHDGPLTGATLRTPDRARLPLAGKHDYDQFMRRSYSLRFEAAFTFSSLHAIPPGLIDALTTRLGIRHVVDSTTNLFGQLVAWQGEDEISLFAPPDWDYTGGALPLDPARVLFFQRELEDGQVHFWGRRDRIRRGDFTGFEVTASVT